MLDLEKSKRSTIILVGPVCERLYLQAWLRAELVSTANFTAVTAVNRDTSINSKFDLTIPYGICGEVATTSSLARLRTILDQSGFIFILALQGAAADASFATHVLGLCPHSATTVLIAVDHWQGKMPATLEHASERSHASIKISNRVDLSGASDKAVERSAAARHIRSFFEFFDGLLHSPAHIPVAPEDISSGFRHSQVIYLTELSQQPNRLAVGLSRLKTKLERQCALSSHTVFVGIYTAPCGLLKGDAKQVMREIRTWFLNDEEPTLLLLAGYLKQLSLSEMRIDLAVCMSPPTFTTEEV